MNRITNLFETKKAGILSVYFTAGYPQLNDTTTILRELEAKGVNMVEVGIPFSDPMADGPVIQESSTVALRNGMSIRLLFQQLKEIRQTVQIPIILMGYLNPIMQYGFEAFCQSCVEVGVDGMIIPDLPFDHDEGLTAACKKYGMENIPVASPSMDEARLSQMAHAGFPHIYASLRVGITGTTTVIDDETLQFISKVREGGSAVYGGFGISTGEQSKAIANSVEAVIAGSVFVRLIKKYDHDEKALSEAVEAKARELCGLR